MNTYLPRREEWISIKNRIIYENERVQILTKISVDIDIKTGDISFSLPDFGLSTKETIIESHVWEEYKDELVNGQETWGVVELGYRMPDDMAKPKIPGKIKLTGFTNFCPYTVDLDYYKDARNEFTVSEWIDVLLGAIDYNAAGYKDEGEKLAMLMRLLPFVEKRINLLELAPKGTGKSYVFGNISKYGLLTDGGKITRAKMFYDVGRRTPGFICGHDYVAIDEVKLVTFNDVNEMRSIMQGYMEKGTFNIGGYDERTELKNLFHVVDDDKIPLDESSRDDYRLQMQSKYLRKFVARFNSKKANRERIDDVSREFKEELGGILNWNKITYRYCGRYMTELAFSDHFRCYELLLADIVELNPSQEQRADLERLKNSKSDYYIFATADEINGLGVAPGTAKLGESIADHTKKILQETEK